MFANLGTFCYTVQVQIASAIKFFRPIRLKMVFPIIGFVSIMQALKQFSVVFSDYIRSFLVVCSVIYGILPTRHLVKQVSGV